ncbi:polysaccharide biosynthesis/export family protein, partial [Escherichia coli]
MKITNFRQLSAVLLLACVSCVSCASFAAPTQQEAQAFGMNTPADNGDGRLQLGGEQAMSGQANTSSTTGTFAQQNRQGMLLPGESDVRKLLPQSESGLPPPYGANLFAGGYETERSDGLNDNYLIAPGDKLNIWIWGA